MNRFLKIGILLIIGALTSCVEDLPIDDATSDKIAVLNCVLTTSNIQHLSLTRSNALNGSLVFKEITEADITLFEEDIPIGKFTRKGYKDWQLAFAPTPGKIYTIQAELPDDTHLKASTRMPHACSFTDKGMSSDYKHAIIQNNFHSPVWISVLKTEALFTPLTDLGTVDMATQIGTDHKLADTFNTWGDMQDMISGSTTQAFSFYIRLRTADSKQPEQSFYLETLFGYHHAIVLRTASNEYDRYLKTSLQKMLLYEDESDPIQWFDESTVFSNISGGVGIFAACHDKVFYHNK